MIEHNGKTYAPDKNGWYPLECAPMDSKSKALYGAYKDGKWYELLAKRGKGVGGASVNVPTGFRSYTTATHWQPLPKKPEGV